VLAPGDVDEMAGGPAQSRPLPALVRKHRDASI
jgi:hypothetical protein